VASTGALSTVSPDVPDAFGAVDEPGWVGEGVDEPGSTVFTAVLLEVLVTVPTGPVLDVTEVSPVGAPPLGLEDCDEQPAANQGLATDKSNTDGKNDFIRVPRRRTREATQMRLAAS
jgi:hypothetical protein